jgi:hypothetical protein
MAFPWFSGTFPRVFDPKPETTFAVLEVVATGDARGLTLADIARGYRPARHANRALTGVGALLGLLARRGLVERAGSGARARYRLSHIGRAFVATFTPPWRFAVT